MRTMLKVSLPVEPANKAIQNGSLPRTFQSVIDRLRPEASYFYAEKGRRTALFVFDLKEPAQIPSVVEPLFLSLNADVELYPAMNAEDMKKGVEQASREARREPVAA